jgi:transcriptional regulator with XRE-family HTH domain
MTLRPLSASREATLPEASTVPPTHSPTGRLVRELRRAKGRTLTDVASQVGISVSYLSQIERGVSRLPIGVLKGIADALGVHMNWFFEETADGPGGERDVVVRAGNRRRLTFTGLGITEELLSPDLAGPLELLLSSIHPGSDSEYYAHDGHEAGVVLAGTLELWVEDRRFELGPGDSFSFPSTHRHRCLNRGEGEVQVLWVITPSTLCTPSAACSTSCRRGTTSAPTSTGGA